MVRVGSTGRRWGVVRRRGRATAAVALPNPGPPPAHLTSMSVHMMTHTMSVPTVKAMVAANSGSSAPVVSTKPVQSV